MTKEVISISYALDMNRDIGSVSLLNECVKVNCQNNFLSSAIGLAVLLFTKMDIINIIIILYKILY